MDPPRGRAYQSLDVRPQRPPRRRVRPGPRTRAHSGRPERLSRAHSAVPAGRLPDPLPPGPGQASARASARTAVAAESVSSAGGRAFSAFALFLASSVLRSLFSGVTKR